MFQSGTRSVLGAFAAVVVLHVIVFVLPAEASSQALTSISRMMIPALLALVVCGRGHARAFGIGGLAWFATPVLGIERQPLQGMSILASGTWFTPTVGPVVHGEATQIGALAQLLMIVVAGWLGVAVRFASLRTLLDGGETASYSESDEPDRLPGWLWATVLFLLLGGVMMGLLLYARNWNWGSIDFFPAW